MRTLLNLVWLFLAGIWLAMAWAIAALLMAVTIIGLPFARVSLRIARYALWPFGRTVIPDPERTAALSGPANVIWVVLAGWWLALAHLFSALFLFITVIGIPFGVADLKMVPLAFAPFGKRIVRIKDLAVLPPGAIVVTTATPSV